ncbi:HlyD family secretion protein [bacterium]|nr:HlyD family secretion protein [bacterium]
MATWKIITGSASALLGVAILVAASMSEFRQGIPGGPQPALAASVGASSLPVAYSGIMKENAVVATGSIDVEGGTVPLTPRASGMVTLIPVQEGASVKKGDAIVVLDSTLAKLHVEQAEAAVKDSGIQVLRSKEGAQNHKHKIEQLRQSVLAAESRLQSAERQTNKLEALRPKQGVAEETFLSAKDQLIELQAMLRISKEQLAEAEAADPQLLVRSAEASESAALAKLSIAKEELTNHTLTAPSDGRVLRIQVGVGQILSATMAPTIWFCPDKPFIVRCEVDQEFADRIAEGASVVIHNENFDGKEWDGQVRRCSTWVAPRRTIWNKVFEVSDVPTVECIVDLPKDPQMLRIGQRVRVTFQAPPAAHAATSPPAKSS